MGAKNKFNQYHLFYHELIFFDILPQLRTIYAKC